MQVTIAAVGRARPSPERALAADYLARCGTLGRTVGLGPFALVEVEEKRPLEAPARMASEGERLRAAVPAEAVLVALDSRGVDLDSEGFAARIAAWRDAGARGLGFVIGGADGLAPELRDQAMLRLAFGRMTWPHLLVRVLLAEQLYRATAILAGHPYHRG